MSTAHFLRPGVCEAVTPTSIEENPGAALTPLKQALLSHLLDMYPGTRSYGGSSGEQNEDWSRGRVLLRQRKKTKQLPAQLLLSCSGITAHAVIGPHFVFSIPKHLCAVFAVL